MKGYAPGWQVRCTRCGRTRDASEAGITRVGAWSWKKYTLGWCAHCRWLRFLAIERKPTHAGSAKAQSVDA
ncbi:MAG: hypothetical protein U0790_19100 [Isosphaeraceae bacterium]